MKLDKVLEILEKHAPLSLSHEFCEKYDAYDNSGIIVNSGDDIKGAVFSLDLTLNAVKKAIECGYNLIITHHPAIYKPIKTLNETDALYQAITNKIAVISMHLNLDAAKYGIDYWLAKGLGAEDEKILMPLGEYGYGRIFSVNKTLNRVEADYKNTFNSNKVFVYGDLNKKIQTAASFCGAGFSDYEYALSLDADLIISADIPHHMILKVLESGRNVMQITHYASEIYGFEKFYDSVEIENKTLVKEINM